MKLWICVVGGEESAKYDQERVIAAGDINDIDAGIDKYENEVSNDWDKYFWVETDTDEWTIESAEQYYDTIRDEIINSTSLQRIIGTILLPKNF